MFFKQCSKNDLSPLRSDGPSFQGKVTGTRPDLRVGSRDIKVMKARTVPMKHLFSSNGQ